ncbi:D-alanyl-D-alanine dipeptidase, partial [Xanthomonas vasicola pv. musacearum NCPPB 4384]
MIAMAPSVLVASDVHVSSVKTAAEAGLVDVHVLAPNIALDMRYASSNNFTGQV